MEPERGPRLVQQRHGWHRPRGLQPHGQRRGRHGPRAAGGTAYVFLTESRLKIIGGFGLPFLDAERLLVGVATIDPFRSRTGI